MGFAFMFIVVSLSGLEWSPLIGFSIPVSVSTTFVVSMSRYGGKIVALSSSLDWLSLFVPAPRLSLLLPLLAQVPSGLARSPGEALQVVQSCAAAAAGGGVAGVGELGW